jgi:hypothetical protein
VYGIILTALPVLLGLSALWARPAAIGQTVSSNSQMTDAPERRHVQAPAKSTPGKTRSTSGKHAVTRFRDRIGESAWNSLPLRLNKVNHDIDNHGYLDFPEAAFSALAGYSEYEEVYDWDSYFENIYMSYYGVTTFTQNNAKIFLQNEREDGLIARALKPGESLPWAQQQAKPFLAQLVLLGGRQNGRYSWLEDKYNGRTYYERLTLYLAKWSTYDLNGVGLVVWPGGGGQSGMDNQSSRTQGDGVDINCYLVREWEAMAILACKLGRASDANTFQERAAALSAKIQVYFWDDRNGFFYDRRTDSGAAFIRVKSVAGFIPLWLGIATPAQAKRLVREHLLNTREFWLKYPVATYAHTEPDFVQYETSVGCNWRGPAWIVTNYMIMHGLMRYGYMAEAKQLAYQSFDLVMKNAETREYYNSETGEGIGLNPFWGWSTLAYFMPLEFEMGYDPSDLDASAMQRLGSDVLGVTFPLNKKTMRLDLDKGAAFSQ